MVNLSILPHHDIEEHHKTLLSIAASKGPNYRFGPLGAESQKKIKTKERHQETAMQRSFVSFFWYFACIASERGIRGTRTSSFSSACEMTTNIFLQFLKTFAVDGSSFL